MKKLTYMSIALLAGCTTGAVHDRVVEVDKPIATHPITAAQIPPLPGQLGPRPKDAASAADAALAGRCDAIAFVIRAYPLLQVAAGQLPTQAPDYKECDKR